MSAGWRQVEQWSVFAAGELGGNPCLVVHQTRGPQAGALRALAARSAQEVTWVGADPHGGRFLRFFVPGGETEMCVHGAIAAVTSLVAAGELTGGTATFTTAAGPLELSWSDEGPNPIDVTVTQPLRLLGDWVDVAALVTASLSLPDDALGPAAGLRVASVSRPKLMVPLSLGALKAAYPREPALSRLCADVGATGVYVFADRPQWRNGGELVARQFPVAAGITEDAATGVAAAALAADLADRRGVTRLELAISQGEQLGRPCLLRAGAATEAERGTVLTWVTGAARRSNILDP